MSDWKGTKVGINIYDDEDFPVNEFDVLLDTDTMADIFERYPPSEFKISIMPLPDDEDIED